MTMPTMPTTTQRKPVFANRRTHRCADMRAKMSPCRSYRYSLERHWNVKLPSVMFIGLNPSTADEQTDDPTVRRCIGFAKRWGFGSLILTNLFSYRSKDPKHLLVVDDPIGRWNDRWIDQAAERADLVVAAWGALGGIMARDQVVAARIATLYCLGKTKGGHPRHPLYLAGDLEPTPFRF